jgi:MFS family permease
MFIRTLKTFKEFLKRQSSVFNALIVRGSFANLQRGLTENYMSLYTVLLGADLLQLGTLKAIANTVNALISAPIGWISDRFSLKKIFLIGLMFEALMPLGYALSGNWQILTIPIILGAMVWILPWTIEKILLSNALNKGDRALGFGIFNTITQIPMIFAPTIAGYIVTWLGGISIENIRPIFYISFITSSSMLLWIFLKIKEHKTKEKKPKEGFIDSFKVVLTSNKQIKKWLVLEFLRSFSTGATLPFIMVYAAEIKNANALTLGFMGSAMTIVSILSFVPLGNIADKIGRKKTIFFLRPIIALSYLILILAPSSEFLILAFALRGILRGSISVWITMRMEMVPPLQKGRWTGIINIIVSLTRIPAPIIGGIIWTFISPSFLFLLVIFIDIAIIMPLLWTKQKTLVDSKELTVNSKYME